jgi:hypothetical protein
MAKFELLVPHLIRWEAGVLRRKQETVEELFLRALDKGYCVDEGGPTMIGVTLTTYTEYCKREGLKKPGVEDLKQIPLSHWMDISKTMYWDVCRADLIRSQSVANMLVDWAYNAGNRNAVKGVQRVVNAVEDGKMGPKTLEAINARDAHALFEALREARLAYYDNVVEHAPQKKRYLEGWRNRTNNLKMLLGMIVGLALTCSACGTHTRTEYVPLETRTTEYVTVHDTTVLVPIPAAQDTIASPDTVSYLHNDYAYSWARYSGGLLSHSLSIKPGASLIVEVPHYEERVKYVEKPVLQTQRIEVEKKLTLWQKCKLWAGEPMLALLVLQSLYILLMKKRSGN